MKKPPTATRAVQLQAHLLELLELDREFSADGNYDAARLDVIRLCIDSTREELRACAVTRPAPL